MMTQQQSHQLNRILLIAILLIAIGLRFHYLMQIEHNVDHAYPVWQALRTLSYGELPLTGQISGNLFQHPPLTGYLYVPILALSRSLVAIYVLVITLNTLGVYITYRLATDLLGSKVGLIASALLAVNPWVIEYSRYSWPPALLPFLVPLVMWLFTPIFLQTAKKPSRRLIIAFLALGAMCQTTLLAYIILPSITLLTLIFIRRLPLKALLIGTALFGLMQVPYAIGLSQNWQSVQAEVQDFAGDSTASYFRDDALRHAFRLVSGAEYELARGIDAPQADSQNRHGITRWFTSGVSILLAGGIIISVLAIISRKYCNHPPEITTDHARSSAILLLVWFIPPIMIMSYNATSVHPYYQLVGVPAGAILAAWGITYVFAPYTYRRTAFVVALFIPYTLLMGINSARFYQETQSTPGTHDLGALPLDWGIELGNHIREHLPENGVVFADVDEWTMNSLAVQSFPLIRDNRAPELTIIPARGGLYIVAYPPDRDSSFVPEFAERVDTLNLPDSWTITVDLFPAGGVDLSTVDNLNFRGEKWLSLIHYEVSQTGDTVTVTSMWRVENLTPEIAQYIFAPFLHVYNADGERIQIVDGKPLAGALWRDGDVHIHRMSFSLEEDVTNYSIQMGQYDGMNQLNLILITPDGEYVPTIELQTAN